MIVYVINGLVILLLLIFFAVLSMENNSTDSTSAKKTFSGYLLHWRMRLKQMLRNK